MPQRRYWCVYVMYRGVRLRRILICLNINSITIIT